MANLGITLGATRERPGFSDSGDLITLVDIPYSVAATGARGMVSIPKNQFSAELAQTLIMAEVAEIVKLHNAFTPE